MTEVSPKNGVQKLKNFLRSKLETLQKGYIADNPQSKAKLAKLRRVSGQSLGDSPETWEFFVEEELAGGSEELSKEEKVGFYILVLYATHQQSQSQPMHISNLVTVAAADGTTNEQWRLDGKHSLGAVVRKFVDQQAKGDTPLEKTSAFKRLVNIISSHELEAQVVHLRGLVQLLKSQSIALDYVSLAEDLYWLQFPSTKRRVTLRWGRQLYRTQKTDDIPSEEQ